MTYAAEFGIEATHRLSLQEEKMIKFDKSLDNCGKMSVHDSIKDVYRVEKRIMEFINKLSTELNKSNTSPLISISFIAKSLNLSENIVTEILQRNGLEVTTTEDEEE